MSDQAKRHSGTKSRILLIVIFSILAYESAGQGFDAKVSATHWTVKGEAMQGFSSDFDFSAKVVEKGWWRYSRTFGRPLNMKSYYSVTIPSEENQGNVDIELLARVVPGKAGSTFFLTVNSQSVPESKLQDYLGQVRMILQEFKRDFYLRHLQDQLRKEEKKAKKLSKKVDRSGNRTKEKALQALMVQEQKLAELRQRIKAVYQAF